MTEATELTDAEIAEMFGGTFHEFDAWLLTRPDLACAGTAVQLNEFEIAMIDFTDRQYRDGARLLRKLLPKAKAMVPEIKAEARSEIGKAAMPYLREDNLQAVMIYEVPTGGWMADVLCKHVPPGISNAFGTPVGEPLSSREEALEGAVRTLAVALAMSSQAVPTEPMFQYYDCSFTLHADLLALMSANGAGYESVEHAHRRLTEITKVLFPNGYTYERMEALPEERRRMLFAVAHMASLTSVLRYPPLIPGKPVDRSVKH